jgi:hypothetical protein
VRADHVPFAFSRYPKGREVAPAGDVMGETGDADRGDDLTLVIADQGRETGQNGRARCAAVLRRLNGVSRVIQPVSGMAVVRRRGTPSVMRRPSQRVCPGRPPARQPESRLDR